MVNTTPVEGRGKITSQQLLYDCPCGNTGIVFVKDNDSAVVTCTYCQTEYMIRFESTIRKTTKQINKELGYDISND